MVAIVILICLTVLAVLFFVSRSRAKYQTLEGICVEGSRSAAKELDGLLVISHFFSPDEEQSYRSRYDGLRSDAAVLARSAFFKPSRPGFDDVVSFCRKTPKS